MIPDADDLLGACALAMLTFDVALLLLVAIVR